MKPKTGGSTTTPRNATVLVRPMATPATRIPTILETRARYSPCQLMTPRPSIDTTTVTSHAGVAADRNAVAKPMPMARRPSITMTGLRRPKKSRSLTTPKPILPAPPQTWPTASRAAAKTREKRMSSVR